MSANSRPRLLQNLMSKHPHSTESKSKHNRHHLKDNNHKIKPPRPKEEITETKDFILNITNTSTYTCIHTHTHTHTHIYIYIYKRYR